jgi:hypothetical protein
MVGGRASEQADASPVAAGMLLMSENFVNSGATQYGRDELPLVP